MRSAALGVALLVAVVSGCSADAAPAEVEPLASGTASSAAADISASTGTDRPGDPPTPAAASSTAPSMPAAARAGTASGAVAFARYYLDLVGDGFARADSSAVRAVTQEGCDGCDAIISVIDSLAPEGRRRVGGRYVVREAVAPQVTNGDVIVLLAYERTPSQIVGPGGTIVESAPATPLTDAQMRLVRYGDDWRVQGYRVVA